MLSKKLKLLPIFIYCLFTSQYLHAFNLPKYFDSDNVKNRSNSTSNRTMTSPDSFTTIKPLHSQAVNEILDEYHDWKGVKYRWGGDSRRGIDCSAFTRRMFKEISVHLPRTSSEQLRTGKKISKKHLKAGDLVFFKTSRRERHVGIYVGNDQFIHASTNKGVTTSSLNNSYWLRNYEASVRVT